MNIVYYSLPIYMQFFLRGACKEGSACKFIHEKDNEAPMRQAISSKDRDGEEPIMRQVISSPLIRQM